MDWGGGDSVSKVPHKCENLSSILRTHVKMLSVVVWTWNPTAGEAGTGGSEPAAEPPTSKRACLKK